MHGLLRCSSPPMFSMSLEQRINYSGSFQLETECLCPSMHCSANWNGSGRISAAEHCLTLASVTVGPDRCRGEWRLKVCVNCRLHLTVYSSRNSSMDPWARLGDPLAFEEATCAEGVFVAKTLVKCLSHARRFVCEFVTAYTSERRPSFLVQRGSRRHG
jgi:hypothetical protein